MSERSTDDIFGNAERLARALADVATDAGARERLGALRERAQGVVEEIARASISLSESTAAANSPRPSAQTSAGEGPSELPELIPERLHELRACVEAVGDVLGAAVERLETIEEQLGDPDGTRERLLVASLERCEHVLQGIEWMVGQRRSASAADGAPTAEPTIRVLVVSASSRERAQLCLALEHHGLTTVAALDQESAMESARRHRPEVAVLAFEQWRGDIAAFLGEWKAQWECGLLPPAVVVGEREVAIALDFARIETEYGGAALAAALLRLKSGSKAARPTNRTRRRTRKDGERNRI